MSVERVLVDVGQQVEVTFTVDGVPTDADGDIVNVTVTHADGSVDAPVAATAQTDNGVYRIVLPAQADVDRLTLAWTGEFSGVAQTLRTRAEIVGAHYFTIGQLRAAQNNTLADTTSYPLARLTEIRSIVENRIEGKHGCDVAFVPRYGQATLTDGYGQRLILDDVLRLREVLWCRINGTALTADELADLKVHPWGAVDRKTLGTWAGNDTSGVVEIGYSQGYEYPPDDLVDAAVTAAHYLATSERTGQSARAVSVDNQFGNVRYSTAGEKRTFGIPDVDAVISSHSHRGPFIA